MNGHGTLKTDSPEAKRALSLATLQKYAHALGCRLELRLVNEVKTQRPKVNLGAQPDAQESCAPFRLVAVRHPLRGCCWRLAADQVD